MSKQSQTNKNYTAIEVLKGDMHNLQIKVDEGFTDIKSEIRELRDDIKDTFVTKETHERDLVLIKWFVGATLALTGSIVTAVITALVLKILGLL